MREEKREGRREIPLYSMKTKTNGLQFQTIQLPPVLLSKAYSSNLIKLMRNSTACEQFVVLMKNPIGLMQLQQEAQKSRLFRRTIRFAEFYPQLFTPFIVWVRSLYTSNACTFLFVLFKCFEATKGNAKKLNQITFRIKKKSASCSGIL